MLESLMSIDEIKEKPYLMFFWALIIGSIAVIISIQVAFQMSVAGISVNLSGLFAVIFSIIPSSYFITLLINREEEIEEEEIERHITKGLWARHEKDILILLFYFAGLTISFAVWTTILPVDFFQVQVSKINEIRGIVTGRVIGYASNPFLNFMVILVNNLQVMFFAFLFSFIFGAGAVFILVWNASILGVYIGQLSKVLWQIPVVSLSFLPHGIPEIAGYVAAALAGGLVSAAILRKNKTRVLKIVIIDSLKILLLAVGLIFLGAAIEAYL